MSIALTSVGLSFLLNRGLSTLAIDLPSWVEGPSVMAVFGVVFAFFDRVAWRWGVWCKLGVVCVPNLSGDWVGSLTTSFDEHKNSMPLKMSVNQTWRSISVIVFTDLSESRSLSASILVANSSDRTLSYEYRNEPRPLAPQAMQAHRGTAVLTITSEDHLTGHYYSGRGRLTYGSIELKRVREGVD